MGSKSKKFHEQTSRSLVKALTFRIIILASDAILVYYITRRYDVTLGVMLLTNFSSTIIYFLHERVWNSIHWGKKGI